MPLDRLPTMQPQSDSNYGWMAYQHLPKSETPTPLPSAQLEHGQTLYRFEANVFHSPSTIFAMATLPPLDTFKLEDAEKPRIGFRVIASGGEEWLRNSLGSRDPQADATSQTLLAHLAWKPAPFVSLWKSWSRAVSWAKSRQRLGGEDIDIVAVWMTLWSTTLTRLRRHFPFRQTNDSVSTTTKSLLEVS